MKPTTMLFRNLMAMDVEECIRAYPLDAVVLLSGCDKTTPAMLMGAASADVPARTEELGSGTDLAQLSNFRHPVASIRSSRTSARTRTTAK
jgi:dihydroxyacid dehydratase/phosphogluconate dehydratase